MYRLAYRNFGDHESLVLSHSVNVGSGMAGVLPWKGQTVRIEFRATTDYSLVSSLFVDDVALNSCN